MLIDPLPDGPRIICSLSLTQPCFCHSPGGVTAAALADGDFIRYMLTHQRATMQQPWRSLCSLLESVTCLQLQDQGSEEASRTSRSFKAGLRNKILIDV